jgi:hypothetical protein
VHGTLWIGALVMLRDLREKVFISRVESVGHSSLTVAKPMGVPAAYPYPIGTRFDVLWTGPTGLHVLPAQLTATRAEAPVLLWELAAAAEPWVEQRREFARVPVFGRVAMWPAGDVDYGDDEPGDDGSMVDPSALASARRGYLVDISEAAIAASMWSTPEDPLLAAGTGVGCSFTARGEVFRRAGRVHSARASVQDGEMWVVIQLTQSERQAKALRRQVFAAQVDMRRALRRGSEP